LLLDLAHGGLERRLARFELAARGVHFARAEAAALLNEQQPIGAADEQQRGAIARSPGAPVDVLHAARGGSCFGHGPPAGARSDERSAAQAVHRGTLDQNRLPRKMRRSRAPVREQRKWAAPTEAAPSPTTGPRLRGDPRAAHGSGSAGGRPAPGSDPAPAGVECRAAEPPPESGAVSRRAGGFWPRTTMLRGRGSCWFRIVGCGSSFPDSQRLLP